MYKIKGLKEIKQLAGQTLVYGLGTIVPRLLNYVLLTPYFTKNLFKDAQHEYGKVTELYAYVALLTIILTYGMETTFFRFHNTKGDKKSVFSTIFASIIVTSSLFIGGVLIFSNQIAELRDYHGEVIFIKLIAAILAVEAISAIPFAKLRVKNKVKKFAMLKFLQVVLNIGLMVGIYNVMPKVLGSNTIILNDEGYVTAKYIFLMNLIASSFVLILLWSEIKEFKIKSINFSYYREMLVYAIPLMISGLAGVMNEALDRAIYVELIDDAKKAWYDLGIYGANYKLGGLLLIFIQMFRYAAEPYFFKKAADKDSKQQYAQVMSIFVGVIVAMGLMIVLYIDIFKYFIGASYYEGLFIVPYIVFAYILYGILFNLSVWYKVTSKTKYALIIMGSGAVATIVINIIFVPKYAYQASAIAHVVSYTIMVLISYIASRFYYPIKYNVIRILFYIAAGIAIYITSKYLTIQNGFLDFVIKGIVLLIFITFVAWRENIIKEIRAK